MHELRINLGEWRRHWSKQADVGAIVQPELCRAPIAPILKKCYGRRMFESSGKNHFVVLQDRKRLPARFFAELSGLATAHLR